ncbi:MAG: OadG-related small transporter subunit [Oscillospiraceae bacterium]
MNVNMTDLMNSFLVMGQGMAGIFFVLIIIALIVALLAKVTNKKNKDK